MHLIVNTGRAQWNVKVWDTTLPLCYTVLL